MGLIELIIVMAILTAVLGAITISFTSATRSETNVSHRQQAEANARAALTRMREDIHCSYYVQAVAPNRDGSGNVIPGFSLSLTEFANQCAAVDTTAGSASCGTGAGSSCVFLQWCTLPDPAHPGSFNLYRNNSTCDGTSGVRVASDIVAPATGWPQNAAISPTPASWAGNLWPASRACPTSYLPTQAVDLAVNPDATGSPNETYELKDEIVLRNAGRCTGAAAVKSSPSLSVSAPSAGTTGTAIGAGSVLATMTGSSGTNATATITFSVFGPSASAPATCSGWTTVGTATPAGDGSYTPSAGYTPASAGTYWWYASSLGDSNNNAANSTCPATASTVVTNAKVSPTLSVSAPGAGTTGVAIAGSSITAALAGSATPTAAITWSVFGPSAAAPATCTGWTAVGTASPAGDGTFNSNAGYTPASVGNYWWYASFPGDSSNNAANSTCPATVKTVVAAPLPDTFLVANPGTQTAGTAFNVTITAILPGGGTDTTYTGVKTIVFTGPANAPNGTPPTYPATVTFASGVGTASITLFKAASTTLTATQAAITGTSTAFTVKAGAQKALQYVTSAAGTTVACPAGNLVVGNGGSLTAFVAVIDNYGNLAANGASALTITITKVSGGGNAPSPATLTVAASANPAVTSGSSLLKLPNGSPADTPYRASSGALTTVTCIVQR